MNLESIKILNFRNFSRLETNGFTKVNLITGENGSGKTNFLESVFMLSTVNPLRNVSFGELIKWNENYFYMNGLFDGESIEIGYSEKKKALKWNGDKIKKNDLPSLNPIVAFMPDDLLIVNGPPDRKRSFMDYSLSMIDSEYPVILQRYNRALKQRNAQLKIKPNEAEIWNKELIKWGSAAVSKRMKLVQSLNRSTARIYNYLYNKPIEIRYLNNFKIENNITDSLRRSVEKSFKVDKIKGYTSHGPHRDTYDIISLQNEEVAEKKVGVFASQGQTRSLALALKIGLLKHIESETQNQAIVLLDDVLLEIDPGRRNKILKMISKGFQIFITATTENLIKVNPGNPDITIFKMENGKLSHKK